MLPWQTPRLSDLGPAGLGHSSGPDLLPVLVVVGILLCGALGVWHVFFMPQSIGASQCVQIQYGNGISHWECDCPDGRRLRFNTIPTQACNP
jgi:hypothetical protein